ncbi:MAG: phage protein Gp36 family protein [Chitinophagales bacterium]
MALLFITENDLKTGSFVSVITDSINDYAAAAEEIEKNNIALIKGKIGTRYDVSAIFSATGNNRNRTIVKVLTILVLYDLIRRNAMRKVPDDYKEDWNWAMKWLDAVRDGKESPQDLPIIDTTTGDSLSEVLYGNNSNQDFRL